MFPIYHAKRILRVLLRPGVRFPLALVLILFLMVLAFAAVFSVYEEGATFGDGLWTAYITLTTIGYGDFSARTLEGRLVTVFTTLFGIGCFGVFTGIIVEKAMQRRIKKMKGEGTYSGSGHLVIVNVPSYEEIKELIRELDLSPDFREVPCVIVAASLPGEDRELPAFLAAQVDGFVRGLPSSMETLERADVSRARACLLMSSASDPGMDDTNTLTAGLIEKNWPRVLTIMACSRGETMKNLGLFNIDGGISATDLQMGLLVQELEDPGVFEVYSQLSSNAEGSQIYISRTPLGKWNFDPGELTLGQLKLAALRLDLPADILGIKRKSEKNILLNPPNHLTLTATDRLVYMAEERFDWLQRSPEILQQIGKNS